MPTSTDSRASSPSAIRVSGARTHNLKNIDVEIPRNQLVVITGRSGSGKSSLAVDTLYAEGQRQYVECLSIYSRQFFDQLPRPDVDLIEGLQPTLCLDQSHYASNRRSTVGTITEVYDFLRVLLARTGEIHCYQCDRPIRQQTPQQIRDTLLKLPERTKIMILAPMVTQQSGAHKDVLKTIRRERLVRVRVDQEIHDIDHLPEIEAGKKHSIEAITDRIIIRQGIEARLLEAIDNAVRISSGGQVICCWLEPNEPKDPVEGQAAQRPGTSTGSDGWQEKLYSTHYSCPDCDINYAEVEPRIFSFNSPLGACQVCAGLGHLVQFNADLILDRSLSIAAGAIRPWARLTKSALARKVALLQPILEHIGFDESTSLDSMDQQQANEFLNSAEKSRLGLRMMLEKELATTTAEERIDELEDLQLETQCDSCGGSRVSRQARAVYVGGKQVQELVSMSLDELSEFLSSLELEGDRAIVAEPLIAQILHRLGFLKKVGVGYLSLGRAANTLSGGEHQRVRLAASIGTGVTSVCFVLDEPSIGLHQRDNDRLIEAIKDLQRSGNSVIVVEHDEAMIRAADHVIDMGPGAGREGGELTAKGTPDQVADDPNSLTGNYLSGRLKIQTPQQRRSVDPDRMIKITGASGNNLKSIDVEIPLGLFCCVTGVSGSGKSTLINHTLAPELKRQLDLFSETPAGDLVAGAETIDKLVVVDQKPIGRTSRGCPATFAGVFDEIRKLFAATKLAKQLGFGIARFSFNSKSGWCPDCRGHGVERVAMSFMPDIFVTCESCQGKRFNLQTLQVRFGDHSISDVLEMTVDHALEYFDGFSKIKRTLQSLADVGLGYLKLGQPATTLSGGEAQRIKLATELARSETGNTLYILDEPTTGLHFADIVELVNVMNRLVDKGNSLIVIEHNLDVIRCADWVIDLGPEGGSAGGTVVGAGTPEALAENPNSHTGRYLFS